MATASDFAPALLGVATQSQTTISGLTAVKDIQNNGTTVDAATRSKLNFVNAVSIADDAANDRVTVTLPAGDTVATTVSGLGAGTDAKQGRIIAGSSPYEFVDLVYSSTYGKWASAPFLVKPQLGYGNSNFAWPPTFPANPEGNPGLTAGTEAYLTPANNNFTWIGPIMGHKAVTDAGLSLQVRASGVLFANSGTFTVKLHCFPQNDGDTAIGADTSVTLWGAVSLTGATYTVKDTGWVTGPAPVTAKTMLFMGLGLTGQNTTTYGADLRIEARWVA